MYDPLKDHGGYRGRKPGSVAGSLLIAGLIIGGEMIWDKVKSVKQKKLWNGGTCAKCGRKWRYHWFYPKGSRGRYKILGIDCDHCKIHQDMDAYTPKELKNPNKK